MCTLDRAVLTKRDHARLLARKMLGSEPENAETRRDTGAGFGTDRIIDLRDLRDPW